VISGYRAVVDPAATGRALEVLRVESRLTMKKIKSDW
jgi:hypothetical protein